MQEVARETNLSETAFLHSRRQGGREPRGQVFRPSRFAPIVEFDLCGHATLASSHVLWEEGHVSRKEKLHFHTRSGLLKAERRLELGQVWIELDFPAMPEKPFEGSTAVISKALGTKPKRVGTYGSDYLVEVESESVLKLPSPDFGLLKDPPCPGSIGDKPAERSDQSQGLRLRFQVLRVASRDKRRPCDRLGTLLSGPILGAASGEEGGLGLSGLSARRLGEDEGRPRTPRRKGDYGDARAAGMKDS